VAVSELVQAAALTATIVAAVLMRLCIRAYSDIG